jgi:hypothetical protein
MPLSFEGLEEHFDVIEVPWGEDKIRVAYRPGRIDWETFENLAQLSALAKAEQGPEAKRAMAEIRSLLTDEQILDDDRKVPPIIAEWDLYYDIEQTRLVPVNAAAMGRLPFELGLEILGRIMEESQGKAKQTRSMTGGSPKGSLEPSRPGSRSSG